MIASLLLFVAAVDPALAAPIDAPPLRESPVIAPVADADIREFAAIMGRKTAGRAIGGPYPTADKLLLLTRDDKGYVVVAASLAMPVRQSLPPPPPGTLAIIRLHQRSDTIVPGPTADDLAFVAANQMPLFVVGEWARPAPMWEVAWVDGGVQYRTIGEVGEIGPWHE